MQGRAAAVAAAAAATRAVHSPLYMYLCEDWEGVIFASADTDQVGERFEQA